MKRTYLYLFISLIFTFAQAKELTPVSIQFQWLHQFQFAGYYMAKHKGFYEEAGLEVQLRQWRHGIDMNKAVLQQDATFAVSRPSAIIERANGASIIALYATFQASPLVYMSYSGSGINTLHDFVGKRVMTTNDMNIDASLIAMLQSKGIDIDSMVMQPPSFDVNDLIEGNTDLIVSYVGNEPFDLVQKGYTPTIFDPKDYGFDFYNDIVITSQEFAQNNTQTVKNFKEASLKGWEYAFDNIQESVDIIYNHYNTQNKSKEALLYEAKALKELAYRGVEKIGQIDPAKIQRTHDVYKVIGVTSNSLDVDGFIFDRGGYEFGLSAKERAYLQNSTIKVCTNPDFTPIEFTNERGEIEGISIDVLQQVAQKIGAKLEFVPTQSWSESLEALQNKECDLLPSASYTQDRSQYALFTAPYLYLDLAILTKRGEPFISSIQDLDNKKGVRKEGSAIVELLDTYYDITLETVATLEETFKAVAKEDDYFSIATLPVASYYIQKYGLGNLQISGYLPTKYELSMAVAADKQLLFGALQKGLNAIEQKEYERINKEWTRFHIEQKQNYSYLYKAALALAAVFVLIFVYIMLLRKEKKKAQQAVNEKNESYERLKLALDIAKLATFEWNVINDSVKFDDRLLHLLPIKQGCSLKEFMKLVQSDATKMQENIDAAIKSDKAIKSDHFIATKEGVLAFMSISVKVIQRTRARHAMKLVATLHDMSDHKRLEEQLLRAKNEAQSATYES